MESVFDQISTFELIIKMEIEKTKGQMRQEFCSVYMKNERFYQDYVKQLNEQVILQNEEIKKLKKIIKELN
jgi:hypothetical protein